MKMILVALHIVACQPDLLICKDLADDGRRWTDMGDCLQTRSATMATARRTLPDWAIVMSRCRYLTSKDHRSPSLF